MIAIGAYTVLTIHIVQAINTILMSRVIGSPRVVILRFYIISKISF